MPLPSKIKPTSKPAATTQRAARVSMDPGVQQQQQQQDGVKNMTRALEALAPYLKHPRRTVMEIEALVCVAVAMLYLQLFLAPRRRRSGHWLLQGILWLVYTVSFPLMTYTFGQMLTSPVKNVLYPVWAVILLWAAGCTDVFTVYSLDDGRQWKRHAFDLAQYSFYSVMIFTLLEPYSSRPCLKFADDDKNIILPRPIFFVLTSLKNAVLCSNTSRILAVWNMTNSVPSKLVADYMRVQVDAARDQLEEPFFDPITMKGYRYLVWPAIMFVPSGPKTIRVREGITIQEIWDMTFDDTILNTAATQGGSQFKLVSLSFALSHLLRRRFFGLDCAEAGLPETRRFALDGLLAEEGQATHYSRAFRIIETELGFLYDVFFTKRGIVFGKEITFHGFLILKIVCTFFLVVFLLGYFPAIITPDPIIEVGTRRVDVVVTLIFTLALLLLETLQLIQHLTSDWSIVSLARSYTISGAHPHHHCKRLTSIIHFLRRFLFFTSKKMFGTTKLWQNKMGQSSLIQCCSSANSSLVLLLEIKKFLQCLHVEYTRSILFSKKTFQEVPALIRSEIVSCLRISSNGGPLTNGEAALHLNGVHEEFSWAVGNNSQTVVMLIWHLATEYCSTAPSHQEADQVNHRQREGEAKLEDYKQVATTLSRYCAYLMIFIPELLPGNSIDTTFALNDILLEGCGVLGKGKPSKDELLKFISDSESSSNNNEDTIFVQGLKLGRDLEKEDAVLRWKVMAEFWTETIVYIAPSDNVAAHIERLTQGGEFLTHIWALLTHAGILKRG